MSYLGVVAAGAQTPAGIPGMPDLAAEGGVETLIFHSLLKSFLIKTALQASGVSGPSLKYATWGVSAALFTYDFIVSKTKPKSGA